MQQCNKQGRTYARPYNRFGWHLGPAELLQVLWNNIIGEIDRTACAVNFRVIVANFRAISSQRQNLGEQFRSSIGWHRLHRSGCSGGGGMSEVRLKQKNMFAQV